MRGSVLSSGDLLGASEMCRRAGISYRTLHLWKDARIVEPAGIQRTHDTVSLTKDRSPGSGHSIVWTRKEVVIARRISYVQRVLGVTPKEPLRILGARLRAARPGEPVVVSNEDGTVTLTVIAPTSEEMAG
jgi:hypothetical protein